MLRMILCGLCTMPLCGCEWMVNWMAAEPVPPMLRSIPGVRVIRVSVQESSSTRILDLAPFDVALVRSVNARMSGPQVISESDPAALDAVLSISALRERLLQTEPSPQNMDCKFQIQFSAVLQNLNGHVIWRSNPQWIKYEGDCVGPRPRTVTDCIHSQEQEPLAMNTSNRIVDSLGHSK